MIYFDSFNEYLNFHRPCAFATVVTDKKGRVRKIYRQQDYLTPYEKLKSLVNGKSYLKTNVTFEDLDTIAERKTDNQIAEELQSRRYQLFQKILPAHSSQ